MSPRDLPHDPHWPRAGGWLRGELAGGKLGKLAVLGVPSHRGSLIPGRCDLAPAAIRKALERYSTYDADDGIEIMDLAVHDFGDLDIAEQAPALALDSVRQRIGESMRDADALVLLGGDNSITYPGVQALGDCGLITFDAHLDLRTVDNGLTNGNPVRALVEDGFPADRIVQIGIQSFSNSRTYMQYARDLGIRVITADQVRQRGIEDVVHDALASFDTGTVYVDLDIDVLDRAFAPAAPGSRPGGLTPSDVRVAARLCGEFARVRIFDIVEIDPEHDVADQTVLCAAACILAFASGVHRRCSRLSVARNL